MAWFPAGALRVGVASAASVVVYELIRRRLASASGGSARVIVAVSGTIQDGFELRKNIDYQAEGEPTVKAVLIGYGVVRGVTVDDARTVGQAGAL